MFHRISGCLFIILGLSVGAFGLNDWLKTDALVHTYELLFRASTLQSGVFKPEQWSSHWRFINLILMVFGCLIAYSGVLVLLKKSLGYLLLSCSLIGMGIVPIILRVIGYSRYKWDGGGLWGELPYFAVGLAALLAYMMVKRKSRSAIGQRAI
ncbi:hypothetical protein [Dyella mobilis]|uniref:DUF423 domain-containing protein n=1 Tax=Dyella mobilis TaxID=1849582 RepID=A0ABS2KE61_9GAMM|nr:hypothetical protein [Dyella mobilis]MBM7129057.1 hypothetical protein [Dyella mobilis]GLQ99241.1 hypothetical protein GCM10007863_36610 [Dyella mobilis]